MTAQEAKKIMEPKGYECFIEDNVLYVREKLINAAQIAMVLASIGYHKSWGVREKAIPDISWE